jgi:hypothetical protein
MRAYGRRAPPFLTSTLDGDEWPASRPCRLTPGARAPSTHWIGDWVGPRASLDSMKKRKISCSCQRLKPGHPACILAAIPTELSLILCLGGSQLKYWL